MKALSFISSISLKSGGPSQSVPILVKGLASIEVDVTLMTVRSDDMNSHVLDGTSAKLKILEPGFSKADLEQYIVSEHFNIIHIQSIWEPLYHIVSTIAQQHNIPYIISSRGMLEPWSLSQKKWKKRLAMLLYQKKDMKRAACIFTTAEIEAQHVSELGIKVPKSVIPNGIETNSYPQRNQVGIKKQVLFLSRIHKKKGVELLIEAFSELHADYKDWSVAIVGNGEPDYIESLRAKIKGLGLEDAIHILPPVYGEPKIKLYQESSIFCLPSYSENFGMVIAEAMACGLPAITTNGTPWQILNGTESTMGASLELLGNDKRTGWCIDLNVDNLQSTLREAMSMNPGSLYEMGQRGSHLVRENFDYHKIAEKTELLYEWIATDKMKPSTKPEFVYF